MPAPDAGDLPLLIDAAHRAGQIALRYFRASPETWDKADGAGPVTEADIAVDTMLRKELGAARNYGWLSEETEDSAARLSAREVFIVDPIDGTRSFIEGSPVWAISVAVAVEGRPTAAVVHLPARDMTYAAALGEGATLNGAPLGVSDQSDPAKAELLCAKVNFRPEFWESPPVKPKLHFRSSLAYRLSLIAQGRFDAMMTLRPTWEWDVAAGALLVSEAGGSVLTCDGAPPRFNSPQAQLPGILAGAPALISHYVAHGPRIPPPR